MVKMQEPNRRNDEIDLLELFLNAVNIIRHNFWLIVVFFLVGLVLGVTHFMTSPKQYESKMIISSEILTTSYASVLFENVNNHLGDGAHALLAKDFGMDPNATKGISSLRIENVSRSEGNVLTESDRYLITARVYDKSVLPALQKGILQYLENNEFVRVRVEQNRTLNQQMLDATERELRDLQQLKTEIYNGKFFNSGGNVMFDPTTVNTKILELTQKKIEYQNKLTLSNSVQLIEGFTPFNRHVKPVFAVSVVSGSFFGLLLVGALITFKSIRRIVRMADAQKLNNAS